LFVVAKLRMIPPGRSGGQRRLGGNALVSSRRWAVASRHIEALRLLDF
jgi:hypothetical protein